MLHIAKNLLASSDCEWYDENMKKYQKSIRIQYKGSENW